jgi:hypothetical protein
MRDLLHLQSLPIRAARPRAGRPEVRLAVRLATAGSAGVTAMDI